MGRRSLLLPLVPIYGAILRSKRRLYEAGHLKSNGLKGAVISVGSVSTGGAGKTPMVMLLAQMLCGLDYDVRILTRGYGRGAKGEERVDAEGDAARYGDEPLLLARRSGVPVYVGADRYRAGLLAEAESAGGRTAVSLLDDGFQHRQLLRDLDIVLLTLKDIDDVLLPAGDLREPLSTLREADVIVVRDEEEGRLRRFLAELTGDLEARKVWAIRRQLHFGERQAQAAGAVELSRRPLAFCAIARPESFVRMLAEVGVRPSATVVYRDHHSYSERDIASLLTRAKQSGADGFVTTEKDAVKLTDAMRRRLAEVGPLCVPELRVELLDEKGALQQMISMVPKLKRRKSR